MGLPVVQYTPAGAEEPVVLEFLRGPAGFRCEYAGRVHDNVATSGVKERVVEHLDMLISFRMPALRVDGAAGWDDLADWDAFQEFALEGGVFTVAPNTDVAFDFHCVSEDEGWQPERVAQGIYAASFKWRVVPDEDAPASPGAVMAAYWGVA